MSDVATGAELFLLALQGRGTRFVFMNPGTDTFPVQEAHAKLTAAGVGVPRLVMCPFESLASSAAQGAFVATGQAQLAFVHVDVGTANASGSLNDSKANRTPVVLCAGRSPVSLEAVPGGRTKYINWAQDVPDQAALVRNYTKNEQIAYRAEAIPITVHRAFQVAESDPAGPTYLSFPRESLMEETSLGHDVPAHRFPGVKAGSPNPEDVDQLATWILEAERPVFTVGYTGRDPDAVAALVELSELAGIGVVEYRGRVNFPLTHPHHLGFQPDAATGTADLIVVAELDVPYVPVSASPDPSCKLAHIGHDPYFETIQTWGFPSDLGIRADSRRTFEALTAAIRGRLDDAARARIAERSARFAEEHRTTVEPAWEPVEDTDGALSARAFGQLLHELLPEDVTIFEEVTTAANPVALQLRDVAPGRYLRNGGSYLGWAMGAAAGFGISRTDDSIPVAIIGDGSFLFSVPSAVLWFAKAHSIPMLIIVADNKVYNSVRLAGRDGYPDGAQVRHGYVATDFGETPAADQIAQACGVAGFRASNADEFHKALTDALDEVRAGRPALVTVETLPTDRPT